MIFACRRLIQFVCEIINPPLSQERKAPVIFDSFDVYLGFAVGAGVVSTARLGNAYYGKQDCDDDFIDRTAKEGAHEIGHLLGLPHCEDKECVMFRPDTLDELDRKKKALCPACRELLALRLPSSG